MSIPDSLRRRLDEFALVGDLQLANQRGSITAEQAKAIEEHIVECLGIQPSTTVLEIGCGTGLLAQAYAREGARHVVGMDISHNMVVRASHDNRYPNVRFVQGDAVALGFGDGSFDRVVFNNIILYFTYDNLLRALREMHRVARPGGIIFVGDICDPRRQGAQLRHWIGLKGWAYRRTMALSMAKRLVKRFLQPVRRHSRSGGWITSADFLHALRSVGLTGEIVSQCSTMPYHYWRYDCLVRLEK